MITKNWFIIACAVLQLGGAGWYLFHGGPKLALLYFLYSFTNVIILSLKTQ